MNNIGENASEKIQYYRTNKYFLSDIELPYRRLPDESLLEQVENDANRHDDAVPAQDGGKQQRREGDAMPEALGNGHTDCRWLAGLRSSLQQRIHRRHITRLELA